MAPATIAASTIKATCVMDILRVRSGFSIHTSLKAAYAGTLDSVRLVSLSIILPSASRS